MPPKPTLHELEERHSPHDPAVVRFVGAAIDANDGPLNNEQLRDALLRYENGVTA
jgi:hypothetical protein